MTTINDTIALPSGLSLKNRLVKGATTEGLADELSRATPELATLYKKWSEESGVGLIISGNVQIDRRFMERPGNVVIDLDYGEQTEEQMERLKAFAAAGKSDGCKFFAQLSHGGRQSTPLICKSAHAPSAVSSTSALSGAKAVEATADELERVKEKFIYAAKICQEAGFDGVELHGAHGYLLSSMLSPLANQRTDRFGGSLENRASLLIETVRGIKENASDGFSVAVKLNSSDFQKGGFTVEEASEVATMLADEGLDLLELSGGNYEQPVMRAGTQQKSTKAREAYFLDFSKKIVEHLRGIDKHLPILVTGGFRSRNGMNLALQEEATDLIGIARPLCVNATCTNDLLNGTVESLPRVEETWQLPWFLGWSFFSSFKMLYSMRTGAIQMVFYKNLVDMGNGTAEPLTEQKYPNLISTLRSEMKRIKQRAHNLKDYIKDDEHLQPYISTKAE